MILYDERVAKNYEADRENEEHWQLEKRFVASCLARYRGGRVLDIPVGTGRFLDLYGRQAIAEVVGIDVSPHMLAEARKRVPAGVTFRLEVGNAFDIACPDGIFDAVVCFRLLHLIPGEKRPELLRELLRAGREVMLQIYLNRRKTLLQRSWNRLQSLWAKKVIKPWSSIPSYPLYPDELGALFGEAGARVIASEKLCEYEGTDVMVFILGK